MLENIEGIDHALYANITIWTSKAGSDGWIEETLQKAAETVHEFARSCGLSCSPQKSELVIIKPRQKKDEKKEIRIVIDNTNINPTPQVRILGLLIQENGKAGAAIRRLKTTSEQIMNMIRRVSNRRRGQKT